MERLYTADFYRFNCRTKNFSYLNSKNVLHPKVSKIVWSFIAEDDLKSEYLNAFKEYKDKKDQELGKDLEVYENREEINFEEQKPILNDDFTKEEEDELKQKVESR